MKILILIVSFSFTFSCTKNKQIEVKVENELITKIDKIRPTLEQITEIFKQTSNIDDFNGSDEIQKYLDYVEAESLKYESEFTELIPLEFKYNKPELSQNFKSFQQVIEGVQAHYNLDEVYETESQNKSFVKLEALIKSDIKVAETIINLLDEKFEFYSEGLNGSIIGSRELRQIARALKYSVLIAAEKSNFEDLKAKIRLLHKFALKVYKAKGPLILQLVGSAIQGLYYSTINILLKKDFLNKEQLISLKSITSSLDKFQSENHDYIISKELHRVVKFCAAYKLGGREYFLLRVVYPSTFLEENPENKFAEALNEFDRTPFDENKYIKTQIRFFNHFRDDFKVWKSPEEIKSRIYLKEFIDTSPKGFILELNKVSLSPLMKILERRRYNWTRESVIEVLFALKIYEKEESVLPNSLVDLEGKYIEVIPIDYNTGQQIVYDKNSRFIKVQISHKLQININF